MMRRTKAFFYLLLVLPLPLWAQEAPPILDLPSIVNEAVTHGFDQRILDRNLEISQAQYDQATAKGGINLSASGTYGLSDAWGDSVLGSKVTSIALSGSSVANVTLNGTTIPQNLQGGLNLTLPLATASASLSQNFVPDTTGNLSVLSVLGVSWNQILWDGYLGGSARAPVDKAALSLQGAQLTSKAGKLGLIYKVKQAYYTMLSAQEGLDAFQKTLNQKKDLLELVNTKYQLGQANSVDLKAAQINVKSAEIDLLGAQTTLKTARIRLAILMGRPSDQVFTLAPETLPQSPSYSVEEAIKTGLSQRVELKQLELNQQTAKIDQTLFLGQMFPTISVNGGINWAVDWSGGHGAQGLNAGVKIGLPLIDSGLALGQIKSSSALEQQYREQESQTRQNIVADIEDAYTGFQIKAAKLDMSERQLELAAAQLEITKAKYQAGTANGQDLMTADLNYSNAVVAEANAKINLQLAALLLQNVLGE